MNDPVLTYQKIFKNKVIECNDGKGIRMYLSLLLGPKHILYQGVSEESAKNSINAQNLFFKFCIRIDGC